ncbi:protein PML-like isoform X2 [Pristis pectinata]|uniref:protein PML-like isoform X2 n=1 Tax=Pristis pectinata TaxID=685728 RepID=UPI00223CEC37|nr:protein PML-like isoform X2 [Pristis pectinata]
MTYTLRHQTFPARGFSPGKTKAHRHLGRRRSDDTRPDRRAGSLARTVMESGSGVALSNESVMCGVCRNQLKRPKLLPCLHSVCLECLQNVWAEQNFATCPICGAPSDRDIAKIQDNTLMAYLVSTLQLWQRIGTGLGICCSLCQAHGTEEPATSLCFECDQFLCPRCCHGHQLLIKKYGHPVMSFDDLKVLSCEEFAGIGRNKKQTICPEHKEQQISFFCKTCSTGVCCNCLLLHHTPKGHNYHSIKEEVMLEGEVLKQMVDTTQGSFNRFTASNSEVMSLKERMDLARNEIEASIKRRASAITQEIVSQGDRLLRELETEHRLEQTTLANSLTQTQQLIKRMRAGHELAAIILMFGINKEMMEMYEPIMSALTALKEATPLDLSREVILMQFKECALEAKDLLGTLVLKKEQRESVEDPGTEGALQNAPEELQAEDSFSVKEEITTDGEQQHWHTEHNYSMKSRTPQLPSPSRTEEVTLNISSDDSQQPPAEETIKLSSGDSEEDDDSLMIVEPSKILPAHPETSKAPTDHGASDGSSQMNGDWYREGSSGVQSQKLRGHPLVFFQIQTTYMGGEDIVQLSAVSGEKIFNKYILPSKRTLDGMPTASGFQVVDGVLYLRGEPQMACSLQDAMDSFLHFLQQLDFPLLAGHHIWTHDCQILCKAWEGLFMKDRFAQCMSGFLDTLWLAKKVLHKSQVNNFGLKHLVGALVGELVVPDVQALQKLYSVLKPTLQQAEDSQFTLSQLECRRSLQPLLKQKVVSLLIADKLAFEGISLNILELAHQSDRKTGLRNLVRGSRNLGLSNTQKITRAIGSFLQNQKRRRRQSKQAQQGMEAKNKSKTS